VPIHEGLYGICIHASVLYGEASQIGRFSAGCQVFKVAADHQRYMSLCQRQIDNGFGNSFTYTLFHQNDL
jgi:hypothetical protein